MYGENTNTMAIPIYRVLPYPVIGVLYNLYNYVDEFGSVLLVINACTHRGCMIWLGLRNTNIKRVIKRADV